MTRALLVATAVLGAACSHTVPLRQTLPLSNPPSPKLERRVLLVMPAAQADLVIRHQPDPLADTYVFAGGPAFKSVLLDMLSQVFSSVSFTTQRSPADPAHDVAIAVDLKRTDVVINIYTGNVVTLAVDYTLSDARGSRVLPITASSKDRYSGGQLVGALLLGAFFNIGAMKESAGAAWDQATVNAVAPLLDALLAPPP